MRRNVSRQSSTRNDGIPLSSSLRFGDELAKACGGDEARPS